MVEVGFRLAVGLVLALLVTVLLSGVVATSAAISIELSDGDRCETDLASEVEITATPDNVTALAGNVTKCIAEGDDAESARRMPRPGGPAAEVPT